MTGFEAGDFDRAVAFVSAEPSPRALAERLGVDWDYLSWLALDAAAAVLGELPEPRRAVVAFGGEAFTAGFLIGAHVGPRDGARDGSARARLSRAVDEVQERGRHAVIADHCDLASVARLESVYAAALVESMDAAPGDEDDLLQPVTRIFEAGLAVGLGVRDDAEAGEVAAPGR